jgi:hypothetical protein
MTQHWFFVIVLGLASAVVPEYVTDDDEAVAKLASEERHVYCGESPDSFCLTFEPTHRRTHLEHYLGGHNPLVRALKKAASINEVGTLLVDEYGVEYLLWIGWPSVASVFVALMAILLMMVPNCLCCCKKFAREQPITEPFKLATAAAVAMVLIGALICMIMAASGGSEALHAVQSFQCTTTRFLDVTLRGQTEQLPVFAGLLPIVDQFREAEHALDLDVSNGLSNGVREIFEKTDRIGDHVNTARRTMMLMQDTLALNSMPRNQFNKSVLHECQLCKALVKKLDGAIATLDSSAAAKLGRWREKMTHAMTKTQIQQLKEDLTKSREAFVHVKGWVRDALAWTLDKESAFRKTKEMERVVHGGLLIFVMMLTLISAGLAVCATCSVYYLAIQEVPAQGVDNPYDKRIHTYAYAAWCGGLLLTAFALLVAGVIFMCAAPVNGTCLLMEDLNAKLVDDMAPAFGFDTSKTNHADDLTMMKDVVGKCLKPHDSTTYLFDILFTRDEHGQKVTHRDKLKRTEEAMKAFFDGFLVDLQSEIPPLSRDAIMVDLQNVIAANPIPETIVGLKSELLARNEYQASDMRLHADLLPFLASSVACQDASISGSLGSIINREVPGLRALSDALAGLGKPLPAEGCVQKVTCNSLMSAGDNAEVKQAWACKAGNNYLDLKSEILHMESFRCDMFQAPGSTDGKMAVKERRCNLSEFTSYVQSYSASIDALLKIIDSEVSQQQYAIKDAMQALFEEHIITKAEGISQHVTCNYLADFYRELINGVCYQGVWGLQHVAHSYIWAAVLNLFLVVTMFVVWWRSKNNFDCWKPNRKEYNMQLQKISEQGWNSDNWLNFEVETVLKVCCTLPGTFGRHCQSVKWFNALRNCGTRNQVEPEQEELLNEQA